MPKRKVYYPPSLPAIGKLVQRAFDQMGDQDPAYARPEVRQGLTQFLWITANILAKHLSTTASTDNSIDKSEK